VFAKQPTKARSRMTKIALTSLCLFSTLTTSMLLGCSGGDGDPASVNQAGSAGHAGAKAPFYGLAGGAGTASAGAASKGGGAGAGGAAAGGAGAGGAGAGGAAAAAGYVAGAPEGGRDSFGFGGTAGFGTVIRTAGAGSGGLGAGFDSGGNGPSDEPSFSFGGFAGTDLWFSK
jgi:hypothetical protein